MERERRRRLELSVSEKSRARSKSIRSECLCLFIEHEKSTFQVENSLLGRTSRLNSIAWRATWISFRQAYGNNINVKYLCVCVWIPIRFVQASTRNLIDLLSPKAKVQLHFYLNSNNNNFDTR